MTVLSLSMVVLAALIHATWNLLAKRAAHAGTAFVGASTVVACVAYLPWVVWQLMHGGMPINAPVVACIVASGLLHLVYSMCLQKGYRVADLSVVYPVARGTGPLLSSVGAFVLLGEVPSLHGLLGLAASALCLPLLGQAHGDAHTHHGANAKRMEMPPEQQAWGVAGRREQVTRTIEIRMGDDMTFRPARLEIKQDRLTRAPLQPR
jgi:multidrug transporter EmrE-like cation transporter